MLIKLQNRTKIHGAWFNAGAVVNIDDNNQKLIDRLLSARCIRVEEEQMKIVDPTAGPAPTPAVEANEPAAITPQLPDTGASQEETNYTDEEHGDLLLVNPDTGKAYAKSTIKAMSPEKRQKLIEAAVMALNED